MVTMSSTCRARRSEARSENRAAGDHKEPLAGIGLTVEGSTEASRMYLSSADNCFGCSFLFFFSAAPAATPHTSASVTEMAFFFAFVIELPLRLLWLHRPSPDSYRSPALESPCRSRDCARGWSLPSLLRIPRGPPTGDRRRPRRPAP